MLDKEGLAHELQANYLREWRRKNPEKVKQYNRDYWIRKAEQAKQEVESNAENKTGR